MKIILHGILAERFGREYEIITNRPADAIEGLSRQLPDWPRDLPIDVLDFPTYELLHEETTVTEIHLVPAMHGGGGVGKIVLGVALIVTAAFILPAAIAGATIVAGMTVGAAMFMVGVSLVLMGVSQLFMKAPTIDKSDDPPASKYLGINKNTATIGTLIPYAYGRMKIAGHWLSIQVNSNSLVTTSFPATTS